MTGTAATLGVEPTALTAALAGAVLAVPGVARLEPTLSTAGPRMLLSRSPADGVRVSGNSHGVDVDVNLATTAAYQARAVTHQVQASILSTLTAHNCIAGSVTVSVLTIDAV